MSPLPPLINQPHTPTRKSKTLFFLVPRVRVRERLFETISSASDAPRSRLRVVATVTTDARGAMAEALEREMEAYAVAQESRRIAELHAQREEAKRELHQRLDAVATAHAAEISALKAKLAQQCTDAADASARLVRLEATSEQSIGMPAEAALTAVWSQSESLLRALASRCRALGVWKSWYAKRSSLTRASYAMSVSRAREALLKWRHGETRRELLLVDASVRCDLRRLQRPRSSRARQRQAWTAWVQAMRDRMVVRRLSAAHSACRMRLRCQRAVGAWARKAIEWRHQRSAMEWRRSCIRIICRERRTFGESMRRYALRRWEASAARVLNVRRVGRELDARRLRRGLRVWAQMRAVSKVADKLRHDLTRSTARLVVAHARKQLAAAWFYWNGSCLKAQLAAVTNELESGRVRTRAWMAWKDTQHEARCAALAREHEAHVVELDVEHSNKLDGVISDRNDSIAELVSGHEAHVASLVNDHQAHRAALLNNLEAAFAREGASRVRCAGPWWAWHPAPPTCMPCNANLCAHDLRQTARGMLLLMLAGSLFCSTRSTKRNATCPRPCTNMQWRFKRASQRLSARRS